MKKSYTLMACFLFVFSFTIHAQAPAIEWQKSLGGRSADLNYAGKQTTDGGYIVAGSTVSNNGDVAGNHGYFDYWVVKLNSSGGIEWQICLGGPRWENATSIEQTIDGGFIVAGFAESSTGDVSGHHGGERLLDS